MEIVDRRRERKYLNMTDAPLQAFNRDCRGASVIYRLLCDIFAINANQFAEKTKFG